MPGVSLSSARAAGVPPQLCMLIKGTMQQDSKVITLESRGVLAETGTVRDEALAMLGGGQVNV